MRFSLPAREILVRLACALSLALLAFGHQPLTLARSGTLAVAALPDGSQPIICLTDTAGKGDRKQTHRHDCDACRVSSSFFVPAAACLSPAGRIVAPAAVPLPTAPCVIRAAYPPSAPPRAPPLSA